MIVSIYLLVKQASKRRLFFCFLLFLFLHLASHIARAEETYSQAIDRAKDHAANPSSTWLPDSSPTGSIITVVGGGAASETAKYGIKYDASDTKVIARTATKQKFWMNTSSSTKAPGQDYNIVGNIATASGGAWVTVGNDATKFLDTNKGSLEGADITKLMERGLGMTNDGSHDMIAEYAVGAPAGGVLNDNLIRPTKYVSMSTYDTSTPDNYKDGSAFQDKPPTMNQTAYDDFVTFFGHHRDNSYDVSGSLFPFTQFGYTYFWNHNDGKTLDDIRGMSEFVILPYATGKPYGTVTVYALYPTQSYIYTKNDGTDFSSAADAQYGNGFAGFNVTGSCDTIWAGHRFQSKVKTDTAADKNNKIIISNAGSLSGGQGILVWSLNYDLQNSGNIIGSTSNKWGITNTSDIAVLFRGITTAESGSTVPVPVTGNNTVTNSGTISSPGTAIQADAGNCVITNTGTISGGTYAILTSSDNDTVSATAGTINGKIELGGGTDSLTVNNAQLGFTLDRDTDTTAQILNVSNAFIANAGAVTLAPIVAGTDNIQDGESFLVVDAGALTTTTSNLTVQNDSSRPMLTFSVSRSGNQLSLVAARDNTYYAQASGNTSLGLTLDNLANTSVGDMAAILGSLDASGSAVNARELQPASDNAAPQTVYETLSQFINTVTSHIENVFSLQTASGSASGISTGDEARKKGIWAQIFDKYLHQDPRGLSNGYNANIWGLSAGYDLSLRENFLLGLSAGYARNNIRTKDSSGRTNADSYQGNIYSSFKRNAYYLDGILSYAYNRYDSQRQITFGGLNRVPKSNYGGQQYTSYLETGYTFKNKKFEITPLASLQYMHLRVNGYMEEEAGDANLTVNRQNYDFLQSGLGAKFTYPISTKAYIIIPGFHAKWLYEYLADNQQVTSNFTGGGAAFGTSGFRPAQSSYNIGTRCTLITRRNISFALNYDFEGKSDFYSHSGYANLRYEF